MAKNNRSYIDNMVDLFGYDYVVGYCICSEYDIRCRAENEEDEAKKARLIKMANRYKMDADRLTRERVENGL